MRITVSIILKQIAAGMPLEDILAAYPELEKEDIVQSLQYAAWLASKKTVFIPIKGFIRISAWKGKGTGKN